MLSKFGSIYFNILYMIILSHACPKKYVIIKHKPIFYLKTSKYINNLIVEPEIMH